MAVLSCSNQRRLLPLPVRLYLHSRRRRSRTSCVMTWCFPRGTSCRALPSAPAPPCRWSTATAGNDRSGNWSGVWENNLSDWSQASSSKDKFPVSYLNSMSYRSPDTYFICSIPFQSSLSMTAYTVPKPNILLQYKL